LKRSKESLRKLKAKLRFRTQPLFRMPLHFYLGSGGGRIGARINTKNYGAWKVAINSSENDLKQIRRKVDLTIVCGNKGGLSGELGKRCRRVLGRTSWKI